MNPKPIFGSLQASSNESMVTAIIQSQGTVFVGGYMKDPTLSPVAPADTTFAFIGAYSLSTMTWSWLLIDPLTSPKTTVQSINKSGSFLLVAVQTGNSDSQFYMFYSATGLKAGRSTIVLSNWRPTQNGAMFLGSSTAIFILSNGSKSMLLEIDMNKLWSDQTSTVRSVRDSNNNIDMHFLTTDPLKTYIFVAHTSLQSDQTVPTTNLPAVTIEMIAALDFSTKQQFTLHCSAFGTANNVYPKVAFMSVQGGYEVYGALTVKDPTASVEQSLFRFTFSSSSPFSTTSTIIKTIPCRSILSTYTQTSIYYLVDVASGSDSIMHLVTVNTGFTTIISSVVANLTSLNKPLWEGSAVFVSQTLALFTAVQTKGVRRAYVYQTDATLKNHSTCASMAPVAGALGFVSSTIFVPGTYFAFTAWSTSMGMSYPATHTTGNQGSSGLTAIDKSNAQDIEFFKPVNLGSNFCTFATTFTVTPALSTTTEYIYQLDTGGFQSFEITAGSITSTSCSDEATNLFYEITSVSPSFPPGLTYQLTNGAAPSMSIKCSKAVVPSGPYAIQVSIRLSNGQVFPRQTISLWLNSLFCEQSVVPQLDWQQQVKVLTYDDSLIPVAPIYSPITSQCTASIQLKSIVRPVDGLAVAAGLFDFPNQVSKLMPELDDVAELRINTKTLPYSLANAALYNLELYYKIGMKEYTVIIPVFLNDPCNIISFDLVPDIEYKGANSFMMSADKTVNDKFSFDIVVPLGYEYCLTDLNQQVSITANPAFIIPVVLTSPITIEVRTTEYDQTWIELQIGFSSAQIEVQLGTKKLVKRPEWWVVERCVNNFRVGSIKDRISFWGDPDGGDFLFRDIEKMPFNECLLWANYNIQRVSGGTTIRPGFIVPPTGPTRENRSVYMNSQIAINYSITTIEDVGEYKISVFYEWGVETPLKSIPGESKEFFDFSVFVEYHVIDPCEVFIKPRQEEVEQICLSYSNRPNYVYPTASEFHPECKYDLQMEMKYENGAYGPVESFPPFVGATLVQANFFNSLNGKVVGDFTDIYDKTLQGVYTVKVDIQWASGTRSATYYKIIELHDCCGWPASKYGLAFATPWSGSVQMTGKPICGTSIWIFTFYPDCVFKHQVLASKDPSQPPDTSSIIGPHSYVQENMGYQFFQIIGNCPTYDWDREGTYTYSVDVQFVSDDMYITYQDFGQHLHWDLTAVWIDPCINRTIPPTSLPYMEIMLSLSGFPKINPIALDLAGFDWCGCSISVSVQKEGVPFVHPEIFIYPGLTRADYMDRVLTEFVISPPYDLSLLGLYDVTVDYQWWRAGFASVPFQVKFIDPCVTAIVPPYLPPTLYITGWNQIFTFSVGPNIQASLYPYCKYSITATVSKLQAPDTIASVIMWTDMIDKSSVDLPDANLSFNTAYDPDKVGDYTIVLSYSWGTPALTQQNTFIAILEDECVTAFIAVNQAQTYYVGGTNAVFPISPQWIGYLSFCQVDMVLSVTKNTSPDTSTSVFTWTPTITDGGLDQFNASPISVTLSVYDLTLVGVYTFVMNLSWSNPVQSTVVTFVLTVLDGCATYVIPPAASTKTRNLTDPDGTATWINVAPAMITPFQFCAFNILGVITKTTTPDTSAAVVSWTDMIAVSSVDLPNAIVHYIAQSYTLENLGTYTIQMTYTYGGASFNDQSVVETWTLNIIDPCLVAVVPATPPSYTYYVTDPDIVVNLAPTIDVVYQTYCVYSISMSCAKTETPDTCTNIFSGFAQTNVYYTAIPTQTQTLVISPETYENIGTYTFSVVYNWGGTGNTTTATKTFTLQLKNPCSDIGAGGVLTYPARTNIVVNLLDPNTVLDVTPSIAPIYQFCSASVEMTRTKDGAADTTTLLSTWVDKVDVAIIAMQGLQLTFTHDTYDPSLVGVYSVVLKYTAYGALTTQLPFTFTVVDPCIAAVVPPTILPQTKWLSQADFTQNYFPAITAAQQPYCVFSLTLTVTKLTSPDTSAFVYSYTNQVDILFSQNAQTIITFKPSSQDLTHVGTYRLDWKYEWGGTGHVIPLIRIQYFDIKNPCLKSTTGMMSIPTRINLTKNLIDPNSVLNVKPTMTATGFEWCLMTITATVTKSGAPVADGYVTWTDQTNLAVSNLTGTQFTFNTSGYVPAYIGVYTIALTYTWSDPTPITRTFTVTVVDPCATAVVPPTSIPNKSLYIGNPDYTQTLAPTITAAYQAYCVFSVSLTCVKTTTPDTSDTAITFTALVNAMQPQLSQAKVDYLSQIQDLAKVGVYNLAATYTWGGNGAINSAGPKNFVLTLQDPCLAFTTIPTLTTNYVKFLVDPNTSLLTAPTMTTPGYGWCTCSITLTLTKSAVANNDGFVTWTNEITQPISNLTTKTILFNTSVYNALYLGVYSVSLLYSWSTASTSTQAFKFTVNDPCQQSVTPPDPLTIPNYGPVNIGDSSYVQTLAPTVALPQQPYCFYSISMVATKRTTPDTTATAISFTPQVNVLYASVANSAITYNVATQDTSHAGIYDITITWTWGGTGADYSASHSFTLTLVDPCLLNMIIPTFSSTTAYLTDPDTSFSVAPTMSIIGYEWCPVSIVLTLTKGGLPNSDGFVTWTDKSNASVTSLAAAVILFNTSVYIRNYLGVYDVSLQFSWSTATPVVQTFTFTVLDPCPTAITPPASIPNYTAMIGTADYTQTLEPTIALAMQPDCYFTITMVSTKTPLPDTSSTAVAFGPVVDVTQANIATAKVVYKCSVQDLTHTGTYNIQMTYTWAFDPVMTATLSFVLTLQDPCLAYMTLPTLTNQVALLVDPDTSLFVTPTMTTAGFDWCLVSIAGTVSKGGSPNSDGFVGWSDVTALPLSSLTTTIILFNTSIYEPLYVGVYTINLLYSWSLTSTSTQTFTFTVNDPCITAIVPPASISPYTAYIGDPDFLQTIAPTVDPTYQTYCVFSIYVTSVKQTAPDTSATALTFTDMVNALYTALPSAKINYNVSVTDLTHTGVFDLSILYTWGGAGAVSSTTLSTTFTLQDPCVAFVTIPSFTSTTKKLLDNPNTSFIVTPTITPPNPNYMHCQVSISLTLTKGGLPNADGLVTWTDVVTQPLSSLSSTNILFNHDAYEPAYVGVYSVDLKYDWSGPSTLTRSFTFTVVDPCILNNVPSATLPNYTAFVGDPDFIQDIAITVGAAYQNYCVYSISLTSVKTTLPDTSITAMTFTNMVDKYYTDLPNAKINYNVSVPDLAQVGVYNLSVLYQWGGSGQVMSTTLAMVLTLQDPCQVFMVIPTYVNMVGTLLDVPNYTALVTPTISSPNYLFCTVSISMAVTKAALPNSDGFAAFNTIIDQQLAVIANTYVTFHTDLYVEAYIGVYSISLTFTWSGPSTSTQLFTFTVIDPCITAVVPPASIPNTAWWIGDPDQSQSFPPTIDPVFQAYCIYSISNAVTKDIAPDTSAAVVTFSTMVNANYLNNPAATASFNVSTQDLTNTGIYTIVVTYQWGGFGSDTSLTRTFTMELKDPCKNFLTPPTFSAMSGVLLDPNQTALVTPTISSPNYMFCTVTIAMTVTKNAAIDTSPFAQFATITNQLLFAIGSNTITFNIDAYIYSYVGIYTISLAYSWSGPSTSTQVFTFEVIDPCILEVTLPNILDATIEFNSEPLSLSYVAIQPTIQAIYAPYCFFDIAVTQTQNGNPFPADTFVLFADMVQAGFLTNPLIQIGLQNGYYDISLFGVWTITVQYSWNGPTTQTKTFVITYVPPPDPCFLAIAPPLSIASLTNWISDPNFFVDVNPTIDPAHPECLFDISMAVTKNPTLYDTAADVLTFPAKISASLADLPTFVVSHWPELFEPQNRGVYTIGITYKWFTYVTRTYVWTLNDPCPIAISTPSSFTNQIIQLNKLDSTLNVSALISQPQFAVCLHSVNVVVEKAGASVSTLPNSGNPIEFYQINSQDFLVAGVNLITYKTDSTVNYDPSFQGLYDVFVQYRWAEDGYPAPIVVDLTFQVQITDPCVTELTTPLSFPNKVVTYGDQPNQTLDISVMISSNNYDFCAYNLLVDSSQVGSFNKATLIQFNNINWSTVLNSPTAVLTFATFSTFWDPASSGTFTITLVYSWSLSNQNIISFQLDVINHCFQTTIDSYLVRDMVVSVGQGFDVQEVPQVTDAVGKAFGPLSTCGLRVYTIVPSNYKFLNFTESQDLLGFNSLSLGTDLDADQGKYLFQLKTSLASFPTVPQASTIFTAFILRRPLNHKPTFVTPLDTLVTIQMRNYTDSDIPIQWFYSLPDTEDLDNDVVSMSINFLGAESFISLTSTQKIYINDIREDELNLFKPGYYPLYITLSDNKESNKFMLQILSLPANPNSTSAEYDFIDEKLFIEMQRQMNKSAFLTWLASLVVRKVISKYEEYLMSFIEEDDPLDWAYRVLNETGNYTDYALFGWRPGVFWENMTEQEFMDEVRDEIIDWRTAVAVKCTFDRELMPPGWLKDKNPPKAYFRLMTDTGKVRIGFTEKVYIVPDMRMVNNGTIYMNELQMLGDYKRQLLWQKKADQYPVIQVEVIPGEGQDPKMLNFTWNATMQDYEYLDIQVYFDNPEVVSTGYQPDKLRVRFNDPMLFLGVNGHVIDKSTRVIEKQFRKQAARNIKIEHEVWQKTKTIAQVAMISNIILNIFISAALNQMWSMIETQQLIILLLLFEIQLPANAMAFFSQLMAIAAFDYVEVEPWTNWIFQLNSTGALSDRLDQLGMGSIYFLNNLGSFGIIFLVYLILLICLPCLAFTCCRKIPLIYYNKKAIRNRFKWGYLISTIRENSAIIAMCVFINLKAIKWEFVGDWFHNLIAIIFLCMITLFPAYCFWYIYINWRIVEREGIERKRLMARFGMWIDDLKVSKGRVVLWQPVFFIFRRVQLAVACVFVKQFIIQTFMAIFQFIFSIIMVGYVKPWENPSQWKYQLGNEVLLLLVYYHLMCFTPFFPDMEKQWWLGYSVVVLVAGHLAWSTFYIIYACIKTFIFEFRIWTRLRAMKRSNIMRKELFAEQKFLRRKRRAELEKKMELTPFSYLFEIIEEEKQQDEKEKKSRKRPSQLSIIAEEDEAPDSNRRLLALGDNQPPVSGIFEAKQYRNPILDLFNEPSSKFDLQPEEDRNERSKTPKMSPAKSKESPRKRRASSKKGSLNDLFELGRQLDEKYNIDTFANDNLKFQQPKPFADLPTKNNHRTSHTQQEQLRMEGRQQDFGIVNASHQRKPKDNGWLIENQRSMPLSDEKWREFRQFEFDHLPDIDERSAISATNLNREQQLRKASFDDVLQDIRAFGSIPQFTHQNKNGASGGNPRRHISDFGISELHDN